MKPDFNNCILNVTSSIMNKYNVISKYTTLNSVDELIKDTKHVFFIVLDGLGQNIMEEHLVPNHFLRKNLNSYITSVYPPTTVAATTACLSGVAPGISGWVGWHQYFKDINEDVVVFRNRTTYTNEEISFNVSEKYIPYTPFYKSFKNVLCRELYPDFKEGGFKNIRMLCKEIVNISNLNEPTYTYCYWDNPDYLLHVVGTKHNAVGREIRYIDRQLERAFEKCGESTAFIIIADHGLIDANQIILKDYPLIDDLLALPPSIEARTTAFKIKDGKALEFENLFNQYFKDHFKLYKASEFVKEGFLGDDYSNASEFLLDYVSVATSNYYFDYTKGDIVMKAVHAGFTKEEMMVPLVLIKK